MCISTGKYQPARITENRAEDEAVRGVLSGPEKLTTKNTKNTKSFKSGIEEVNPHPP